MIIKKGNLRSKRHLTNGSPMNPSGQWQIGLRFATVQRAPKPHEPMQGFLHF